MCAAPIVLGSRKSHARAVSAKSVPLAGDDRLDSDEGTGDPVHDPCEQHPTGEKHEHGDWKPDAHPCGEPDGAPQELRRRTREDRVGGSADQCRCPADRGGIRQSEHERGTELTRLLGVGAGAPRHRHHGGADREHHGSGGRVRDPHADQSGRSHERQNDAGCAAANRRDHGKRQAAVEVPPLRCRREEEAAHEEEDHRIGIARSHVSNGARAKEWKCRERKQRGGWQGDRASDPPHGHPTRKTRDILRVARHPGQRRGHPQRDRHGWAEQQGHPCVESAPPRAAFVSWHGRQVGGCAA